MQTVGVTLISCPMCAGPVDLAGDRPTCLTGHAYESDELPDLLGREADSALWSAIRALEDSASGARWRLTLPDPPAHLGDLVENADRDSRLLRELIGSRDSASYTTDRPTDW